MSTFDSWASWIEADWHWLIIIACLIAFFVFGIVGVAVEADGDFWIF